MSLRHRQLKRRRYKSAKWLSDPQFVGTPDAKPCPRCGRVFTPEWVKVLGCWGKFCDDCGFRNVMDGLGLPTPPSMLDRFTTNPALTREDYYRQLNKD
jgi:hypothetical protein